MHIFVHYHLRLGGVTRVMQQQTSAFARMNQAFVTISAGPAHSVMGEHRTLPSLDYSHPSSHDLSKEALLSLVRDLPQPHIWHFHNPTLGCHPRMSELIEEMARAGERMILHLHDFAEDQRPQNLLGLSLGPPWFPCGGHIHYIVLTQRDRKILMNAGLSPDQVTLLGNPIISQPLPQPDKSNALVLYPTRAINRKNIGEMLLLSAIAPAGTRFATTLGPGKSLHQSDYSLWQELAKTMELPVTWAITEDPAKPLSYSDAIASSTHLLSTATQEGFGMAFIESIAWQRPLFGRAIPHIQENLNHYGIVHPHLYERIEVKGIDFAMQTPLRQQELILLAHKNPLQATITQGNKSYPARDWLEKTLHDRHPLPITLIKSFHPSLHAETLLSISASLAGATCDSISHLDATFIQRAFSA